MELRRNGKVNNFNFFSVFDTNIEYSVRNGSVEVGTVQTPYPIGEKFTLAGFTWKVVDVNEEKRQMFVTRVSGVSNIAWNGEVMNFVHTKLIKKLKEVLKSDNEYRYLDSAAISKLKEFRNIANKTGILENNIVKLAENRYAIFVWMGTKASMALSYSLEQEGIKSSIIFSAGMPLFISVNFNKTTAELEGILKRIKYKNIDKNEFELPEYLVKPAKYNYYIPKELLSKQFKEDCIDIEEMQNLL